jgi:hypothetical protein
LTFDVNWWHIKDYWFGFMSYRTNNLSLACTFGSVEQKGSDMFREPLSHK